jgi:hypothetical protein
VVIDVVPPKLPSKEVPKVVAESVQLIHAGRIAREDLCDDLGRVMHLVRLPARSGRPYPDVWLHAEINLGLGDWRSATHWRNREGG